MPVSTDSELARQMYETAMVAYDQYKLDIAYQNLEMALREDPDFFLAHFWMYFMSGKDPQVNADKALNTGTGLNRAEQELKRALKYLRDGQAKKVVEHLNLAIDLYPSDPHLFKILYVYQWHYMKDFEGALESIERAIEARPGYALAYNQLGYTLMELKEYNRAEEAFDVYIKLAPGIANPYDSKGDYFMATEQYEKAYESYKKAFEIDPIFTVSKKKAGKAKSMMEGSGE